MRNIIFQKEVDYVQSANTLFHFMKEQRFLESALNKKALVPRYCKENIEYLDLEVNNNILKQIAVLQKCFCDISFHNFFNRIPLKLVKDSSGLTLSDQEIKSYEEDNTHIGFYGAYAIGFSKEWCIEKNLQPIHYLNVKSQLLEEYKSAFQCAISDAKMDERIDEDIINRLVYFKPLQGTMERYVNDLKVLNIVKNFHDEREWRFVPKKENLIDKDKIIIGDEIIKALGTVNSSLENDKYNGMWLKFKYEDIKYLIVPNNDAKKAIIKFIDELKDDKSTKYELISKIEVLSEIRKDW